MIISYTVPEICCVTDEIFFFILSYLFCTFAQVISYTGVWEEGSIHWEMLWKIAFPETVVKILEKYCFQMKNRKLIMQIEIIFHYKNTS